jgi:hypothetical protein
MVREQAVFPIFVKYKALILPYADHKHPIIPAGSGLRAPAAVPLSDSVMFSSRLVLPVSCDPLDQPPSREMREAAERSNAGVIGFLLQGVDLEAMPRPANERLAEALAPLRTRLEMIIEMLGRLSYRDIELPPCCDIELELARITWLSPRPLQRGAWLRIKLYFHPTFREPVIVFGTGKSCVADGSGDGCRVQADLAELSQDIGEGFARLALVTQRRQRAQRPLHPAPRSEE